MTTIDRRQFLSGAAILGLTGILAACSSGTGGTGGGGGGGGGTLTWWDHFGGLQELHKSWSAEQAKALGIAIEYTYNEPGKSTEALQLANQGGNLPDIFSNTLGLPLPALVDAGWLQPITLSDAAKGRLPEGAFTEGITMLDGKIYGLPATSDRQYWACTWFNQEISDEVGLEGPKSYDEMLAALKAIADHGAYAPMTLALGAAGRIRDQVDDLAQAGGFPGWQGVRYDTGEYSYDHDAYLNVLEFLKEINDKGYLAPGTNSFQVPDARGRWAAGQIGFFIDGPWCPGGVRNLNADHLPKMATAGQLTPNGEPLVITRGAPGPTWFLAKTSKNADLASKLIESFTEDAYVKQFAASMDQPPLNLDVAANADVIPAYAWLIEDFKKVVFRAPEAQVRNIDVTRAQALQVPPSSDLGNLVQGYLGGDVTDIKGELRKLSDSYTAAREKAVSDAKAEGADVAVSDWVFSDWKSGQDYTY